MANYTLKVETGKFILNDGSADLFSIDVPVDGKTIEVKDAAGKVYGKLSLSGSDYTFVASSNVVGGEYAFDGITTVDMSQMTGKFTLGTGASSSLASLTTGADADVIDNTSATTLLKINTGAGNDAITAGVTGSIVDAGAGNDVIKFGTTTATITGGAGKDQFIQVATPAANVKIEDYKYAEGDTLKLTTAVTDATLDADGVFKSTSGKIEVQTEAIDKVYKINVANGTDTKDYWTTAAVDSVTLDGSKNANKMVIDASKAASAVVEGSSQADKITLNAAGKATLNVTKQSGDDTVTGFKAGFEGHTLNLVGATLKDDVTFGAAGEITIGGATGSTMTLDAASEEILVQENGGEVKKVAFANNDNQTIIGGKADVYTAKGKTGAVLDFGAETDAVTVDLNDTSKFINIAKVDGAVGGGKYTGLTGKATTFDLEAATKKASAVWGGQGTTIGDTIKLNATNAVQDTVFIGTDEGADTVSGFTVGFDAKSDVLGLWNVADITGLTAAGDVVSIDAKTTMELTGATTTDGLQLQVMNANGEIKKVAMTAADTNATVDATGAELVLGKATSKDTVKYTANQKDALVVDLRDASIYKSIENIDASAIKADTAILVGNVGGSKITVGGTKAAVYGGSSSDDQITLGASAGTYVWFDQGDGKDTVANFTSVDSVKFWKSSVADVAANFAWDDTAKAFKTKTGTDSLTGVNEKTITIYDQNDKAAKVQVGAASGVFNYAADTNIYMGAGTGATASTVKVGAETEPVVLFLDNGVENTINDIYFSGVEKIDASAARGDVILVGSKSSANELTGGIGKNAMWGMGATADTMNGNNAAVDYFWFGTGDGMDTAKTVGKEDSIVLHNIADINDVIVSFDKKQNDFTITAKDGSQLYVDAGATALDGGLTFQIGFDASAKQYTYDTANNSFKAKA